MRRVFFKIYLSIYIIFYFSITTLSQIHVRFDVKQLPQSHANDTLYVAGSFNMWNPKDSKAAFIKSEGHTYLDMELERGLYEYKITRGTWNKTETTNNGGNISNRVVRLIKDTTINILVTGWKDDFKSEMIAKKHTASDHVNILDSAFYIPQLNRVKKIRVYLPKDYLNTKKRFTVLYMHDGQNLFDEFTAGFGEWGIDECLDSLFSQGKKECIVIGIDNGPKRMNEYNPYDFKQAGKGEGNEYIDFIAKTLKPYVDKHLRTLKDKKNTFIAGSSMGGLISLYAVMKYPNVFGGAGIFSPAFWTASGLENDLKTTAKKINSKLFFYAGGSESDRMVPDMKQIENDIKSLSSSKIYEEIDPEAKHNEAAWRKYFPDFYRLIIQD